jgi:hypothetical protein
MHAILNSPMMAHRLPKPFCSQRRTEQVTDYRTENMCYDQ